MLNDIQKSILKTVSDMTGIPDGAVNIRLDGQKAFRQNSEHIQMSPRPTRTASTSKSRPLPRAKTCISPSY